MGTRNEHGCFGLPFMSTRCDTFRGRLMAHSRVLVVTLAIILILILVIPRGHVVYGALYECQDATGVIVITDSPAQLTLCQTLGAPSTDTSPPVSPPPDPPPESPSSHQSQPEPPPLDRLSPTTIMVPLQRIGSLFVVSLTINHTREARLIVDTGASHTILSRRIALDLGLYADTQATPVTLQTVGGPVRGEVVPIESIQVAEAEVRGSAAAIYDLPDAPAGVEGLLGLSFLGHFRVTIDTVHNQLMLVRTTP